MTQPSTSVFRYLRPRNVGLRTWLILSYGLLAVVLVGALSVLIERAASLRLQNDIGLRLAGTAGALAARMDEGLYERLNDMRALSLMPALDAPEMNEDVLRDLFSLMQVNYPEYVWIGITDAEGRVQIASRGLLEGQTVAERPWFRSGRKEPYVGGIRDAVLLAKVLPAPAGEPLRLIDVASPIHDDHGVVTGVIAAHLTSQWANAMRLEVVSSMAQDQSMEVFVLDRAGLVLLGPDQWRGRVLDTPSVRRVRDGVRGAAREDWPHGGDYLTGYAPTVGRHDFKGLGWSILVRQDSKVAFTSIAELRRQIWLVALLLTLGFLLAAVVMARMIGSPLLALANVARRIQAGDVEAQFPPDRGYREARQLSEALRGLMDDVKTHEHELTALAQQLEQRVRDRTTELSDANAQLELLAMTDALTGLFNRRHFGDQLAREVTRAAETGKPVALVTLDIDHFKAINDQHGHPVGDIVLRRVAMLLEEQVRGSDLLARVGGEEFAVLAVEAAVTEASQLGERLRAAIEDHGPIAIGRGEVPVTVSVGVAVLWPRPGDVVKIPERLLAAADDALYRAKRNGRNRVEVAAP